MKKNVKKLAKYLFALYLYGSGKLASRINQLLDQKSIIPIFDHDPSPAYFDKYILWLLSKGFEFISMEELLIYLDGGKKPDKSKIWFTLDDGWRGNLKLLAVIEKYQIPVTLFIPTHAVETGFFRDALEQVFSDDLPEHCHGDFRKLYDIPNKEREKTVYIIIYPWIYL